VAVEIEEVAQGARGLKMAEWEAAAAESRGGLRSAGREAEAAEAEAGAKSANELFSKEMAGEVSAEAAATEMKAAELGMWSKAKDFGKVLAMELLKGAALGLGMEAGMAAWHAVLDKLMGSEKDAFKGKMDACDGAYKTLQPVLTDWNAWLTTHYPDRDSFGTIHAGSVTISKFQVFQAAKSDLVKFQTDEVAPALTTATRTVNALGFTPLIEKLKMLCDKMLEVSNAIATDYAEMVAKELKDHKTEIEGVLSTLKAA